MTDFKEKFRQSIKEKTEGLTVSVNPSSLFNSLSEEYITEIESNPISSFKNRLHNTSKEIKKAKLEESDLFSNLEINIVPVIEEQIIENNPVSNFRNKLQNASKDKLEESKTFLIREFNNNIDASLVTEEHIIETNLISDFKAKLQNASKFKLEESKTLLSPEFNNRINVVPVIEEQSIEFSPITEEFFDISNDLITATTNTITKEELNKPVKENTDLFNQPNSKLVDPNIKSIQNKLKHLEDWVSKISMTGPGSGEVNFRWLDDIDRDSISNGKYLRYNEQISKFQFDNIYQENLIKTVTTVTTNSYFVKDTDYYIGIGIQSNTEITLSDSITGREIIIKDETGNCSNNPITISGNIDNSNSAVLMIDNGSLHFIYNNGSWRII